MSIRVALNHKTEYRYDRLVTLQPHVVRLRPAPHCRTPILSYSLRVEPSDHFLNWQQDPYSNYLARLVFPQEARSFSVEVDLVADMAVINPFDFFIESTTEKYPFVYDEVLARELVPYLETLPAGPLLTELAQSLRREGCRTIDYLVEINQRLQSEIRYLIRMEPGVQTPEETLSLKCGSCRDSAWLMVQLLRQLGLAARFVSGYLIQLVADVPALDGPSGPTNDFTVLLAWAEVYVPGAGWIGLDPTSGLLAGEGHIPLACAADPTSAAAITGSFAWTPDAAKANGEKVHEEFSFEMSVKRIVEQTRVTKPYSDEQWDAVNALGRRIDEELETLDVRLTMGGEPTFVSIDERDAPEWNTTALGPNKRRQADELLRRLQKIFAPGALLFHGQGKWYPGEQLPRWAFGCYWRRDGEPIWEDQSLFADLSRDGNSTSDDARAFISRLAERLGVDSKFAQPGYEDAWYHLWRERRLPTNVDPLENKLDDPEERRRLSRVFEQGLKRVVGYALPLRRGFSGWESGPWFLRREHLFLIPGDSPIGFRLPLDSLPWEVPADRQQVVEPSTFAPRGALPPRMEVVRQISRNELPADRSHVRQNVGTGDQRPRSGERGYENALPSNIVRTALCVEPREGRLHVFMPPADTAEDYLELIAAIEATAAELKLPVLIEGYKPPSDPRLKHFQITPDPGVIEVNTQPSDTWQELVDLTNTVYEEARLTRLCTEKFLLDGRHCGTGGGNHIVIGGPTPADSPVLRRPDLLRSLIACWHNHPSLSYLFSSLFVGPTSQAPRLDEARNDNLYEMEIAFRQIPDDGGCPPWLVDRVFRHLLTDVTGNTHRAEFCIDKLYTPDSDDGRRGLVELRAFEMPPHARMSLVQQLLLRALVARFWETPYKHKLARWGTELHDRFLLPHFVEQDFCDLLHELDDAGYPFDRAWFDAHFEFRFPLLGSVTHRGVTLELRQAIEPWHVLGEEAGAGGTARYVDSSVERIELKVRGLTDARHIVTCNGQRVPLHPTGVIGEFVAGVRYRAWQPPTCLHPTVPVHTPLVFDVYDSWNRRSIGGCQYHVSHPGGRSYDVFPVNAAEAETRRHSRFFPFGHTPNAWKAAPLEIHPEFPLTLDLRKPPIPQAPAPSLADSVFAATSPVPTSPKSFRLASRSRESVSER
jgi:uncharacterized protein (DUF2126 family)/transglutaminase-like putative cysteine protease